MDIKAEIIKLINNCDNQDVLAVIYEILRLKK